MIEAVESSILNLLKKSFLKDIMAETFQKKVQDLETQKLTYYSEKTNTAAAEEKTENLFIQLSLRQIMINISNTFIGIMNDILTPSSEGRDYLAIISKDDRLIYVGLIVVFLAFCLYLVDITS
jgi:hypothetical protein